MSFFGTPSNSKGSATLLNGFQACKKIKKVRRELPIIFLSTKDQESDAFWGKHQGADLYMTKPFDSEELFANAVKLMSRT